MTKEIINVTDIISYLYCPRKLWLRLVKGIKEPPNKKMISGFLKHKIFDIFNKNESSIVSNIKENLTKEQLIEVYRKYLKAIIQETSRSYENMTKSFFIDEEELSNETLSFMEREIKLRVEAVKKNLDLGFLGKELWRNLKPKYLTEFEVISYNLGLKGRIDRIKLEEEILPYEIKTRQDIYEADKIQLAAYSLLLEQEFGKKILRGIIETKKHEEKIEITEEMKNKVLEIAEKIRNLNESQSEESELLTNFNKCKSCKLRKECFEL